MPFIWRTANLTLAFCIDDGPVRLESVHWDPEASTGPVDQPLVEVSALGHGRSVNTHRHVGTVLGHRLRYTSHEATGTSLRIVQQDAVTGLQITSFFEAAEGIRTWTEARLTGPGTLELTSLSSVIVAMDSLDFDLVAGDNDWMAESRWSARPLRGLGLPDIQYPVPRTRHAVTSRGQVDLPLPHCEVRNLFPAQADGWTYDWQDNTLTITANTAEPSARVVELIGRTAATRCPSTPR